MAPPLDEKDREKRAKEDKDFTSAKIGDLARNIGYGVVAVAFALLTSTSPYAAMLLTQHGLALRFAVGLGILTVILDYSQYLAGYIDSVRVLRSESTRYNKKSLPYRVRKIAYWLKQGFAIAAAGTLVYAVLIGQQGAG